MELASESAEPSGPVPIFWLGLMAHFAGIEAVQELERLDFEGKLKVYDFSKWQMDGDSGFVAAMAAAMKPVAVIQRPTTWPVVPLRVADLPPDCYVVNIGVGSEHLQEFHDQASVRLILPDPDGAAVKLSAKMVAQLTAVQAVCLLRRIPLAATLAGTEQRLFHNQYESLIRSGTLVGSHWLCLGGGRQVRELLPLLRAFGVSKVTVWYREKDRAKFATGFARCTELLGSVSPAPVTTTSSGHSAALALDGITVQATNDWQAAAALADVVSIHAGPIKPATATDASSPLPLGAAFFDLLRPSAIVINSARGALVDEAAVVTVLRKKGIAGYATDVLYPTAEKTSDPAHSPLWAYYRDLCGDQPTPPLDGPNLMILPHIGGSVFSLFAAFLDELVPRMLQKLGFTPGSDSGPAQS